VFMTHAIIFWAITSPYSWQLQYTRWMSLWVGLVSNPGCLCVGGGARDLFFSFGPGALRLSTQTGRFFLCKGVPMNRNRAVSLWNSLLSSLQLAVPPTEGNTFAFSENDNSCFGRRELEKLPLPLLWPMMGGPSGILIYIPKCQEAVPVAATAL
jgi:hypothetical protein